MSQKNIPETGKQDPLLATLQCLLELPATEVQETVQQTIQLVTFALHADKVDMFFYDPSSDSLITPGTSITPMGQKEKEIGLDRLPLTNLGRVVEVYLTGRLYITGQAQHDPHELIGMTRDLEIKSEIAVPFEVAAERRGVLMVSSSRPQFFTEQDLHFLQAVSHWIGVVIHRAELAEQQTKETQERARRLAAEELLTVMAHDLRNYLTPLKGRLDLLERRARREGQELYLRDFLTMSQTLARLNRMISELLDVACLDQGMFSLNLQPVDLVDLLEELVPIWGTPEHMINMQAPGALVVTADRARLQQALENLLANAITHATSGTPVQIVVAQEQRPDGLWATVTVSNQGPAISPDLLTSLFHPFVKGAHSKGLGLGLYLAQRIASAHQGTLAVRTEPGEETSFTLALPSETSPVYA